MSNENMYPAVISKDPMDYVECALALEVLSYHNKNFLAYNDNKSISEQIQILLNQALLCKKDDE